MNIRNRIVTAVIGEIERRQEDTEFQSRFCWCSLCEADVTALALNSLPPAYSTTNGSAAPNGEKLQGAVRNAVLMAIGKVAHSPKHTADRPENYSDSIRVINYTFEEGSAQVVSSMAKSASPCVCDRCLADALAFALNRYPPKYGVERFGTRNLKEGHRKVMRQELKLMLSHAANIVSGSPNH